MFVLVALLRDASAGVARGVAVGLQHVRPRHLAVGAALAPRGLLVATRCDHIVSYRVLPLVTLYIIQVYTLAHIRQQTVGTI